MTTATRIAQLAASTYGLKGDTFVELIEAAMSSAEGLVGCSDYTETQAGAELAVIAAMLAEELEDDALAKEYMDAAADVTGYFRSYEIDRAYDTIRALLAMEQTPTLQAA